MTYKISYSALKLMKDCQRCFWWQVKKGVKRPSGPMSQLPNRVEDQILKKFNVYRSNGELPPELSKLNGFKLMKDQKQHDEWKNKGISFTDEKTGFILVAKPDDMLENGKTLAVLDYKTAGASPEKCTVDKFRADIEKYDYQLQADFYSYVLRKNGFKTEDTAYFLFLFVKSLRNTELTLGSKLLAVKVNTNNSQNIIKQAAKVLKSESSPENGCGFCDSVEERIKSQN